MPEGCVAPPPRGTRSARQRALANSRAQGRTPSSRAATCPATTTVTDCPATTPVSIGHRPAETRQPARDFGGRAYRGPEVRGAGGWSSWTSRSAPYTTRSASVSALLSTATVRLFRMSNP